MSEKSYILAPQTQTVSLRVAPAYACLESITLLAHVDEYTGLDDWIYQTAKAITPQQERNNRLLCLGGLCVTLYMMDASLESLPSLLAEVERLDAVALRDWTLEVMLSEHDSIIKKHGIEPFPPPSAADLLQDVESYVAYHMALCIDDDCADANLLRDVHAMLTNPPAMKALILHHLHDMWSSFLAEEMRRVTPKLEATVAAFQKLDYGGMQPMDVVRTITGRDMSNTMLANYVLEVNEMIFIPVPHIGPYVGMGTNKDRLFIMFRPHLPEGTVARSPELDRSELLVRLNALADDTRLRILELFTQHDELCAPQIIDMLALSQSAASRHLRQLTASNYLTERRREGAKCYSLNQKRVEGTLQALQGFLLSK